MNFYSKLVLFVVWFGLLFGGLFPQRRNLGTIQMSLSSKLPLKTELCFCFSLASYRLVSSLKFHRNSRNLTPYDIYSNFYVLLQNQKTFFPKIMGDVINFLLNSLRKLTKLSWLKNLKPSKFLKKPNQTKTTSLQIRNRYLIQKRSETLKPARKTYAAS